MERDGERVEEAKARLITELQLLSTITSKIKAFGLFEIKTTNSASWNSILSLRPLAQSFIFCNVNNGENSWFWYDRWTPFDQLINFLGPNGPRDLRIPTSAHVKDACSASGWLLSQPRSDNALKLHIHLTTITNPRHLNEQDSYHWCVDGRDIMGFSSSKTWEALRPRATPKDWFKEIWFSGAIPRQAFMMWLANYNRLPTKVRMSSWGLNVQTACCFCNNNEESRDHLFLSCPYTISLWRLIFARLDRNRAPFISWTELLSWVRVSTSAAPNILKKLVTQSLIYNTWRQRNSANHHNGFAPPQTTFSTIDRDIRNVISARRHRKKFSSLIQLWIQ
ncbi:uncharacterized protein LOC125582245 [Brassica napus]|nr:PREDICTED: uncharacterized protein LOC106323663 [Brassica oleracea var. oleracea]XP_048604796.1 uncharacterized protein LOC125582245 [Brassica napus]